MECSILHKVKGPSKSRSRTWEVTGKTCCQLVQVATAKRFVSVGEAAFALWCLAKLLPKPLRSAAIMWLSDKSGQHCSCLFFY